MRSVVSREFTVDGRLGVRRFDRFFPLRQDEPGKKLEAGHEIEGKGQKMCAITDKPFEEASRGMGRREGKKHMQDSVKDKEVVTPPRKYVRDESEEVMKGIRVGDVQVLVKAPSRPLPAKYAPGARESAFIWICCVESDSSHSHVDAMRRRGKTPNYAWPSGRKGCPV